MTNIRLQDFSKNWCYAVSATALAACLFVNYSDSLRPASLIDGIGTMGYGAGAVALAVAAMAAIIVAAIAISLLGCAVFFAICATVGYGVRRVTDSFSYPPNSRFNEWATSAEVGLGVVTCASLLGLTSAAHWWSEASVTATLSTILAAAISGACVVRLPQVSMRSAQDKALAFVIFFAAINIAVALPSIPHS